MAVVRDVYGEVIELDDPYFEVCSKDKDGLVYETQLSDFSIEQLERTGERVEVVAYWKSGWQYLEQVMTERPGNRF